MSEHEESICQNCQKLAEVNTVYKFLPKKQGKEKDIYRFQQKVQEVSDPLGRNLK